MALKVLRSDLIADAEDRDRILRELGLIARLQHPNVLPVLECGEAAGLLY